VARRIKLSFNVSSSINYAKIEAAIFLPSLPAGGHAKVNFLECKKTLFATAFFILLTASTWTGFIASHFLFGNLCFSWIQQYF